VSGRDEQVSAAALTIAFQPGEIDQRFGKYFDIEKIADGRVEATRRVTPTSGPAPE
jgi:hypothetical protein